MAADYLKVIYSEKNTPKTDYPDKLTRYLFQKYNMSESQKILEPGCGRGEFINGFKKLGMNVYGCDLSSEAGEDLHGIDVKQCNLEKEKLPYDDNFFDVVYSKSLLEHLWKPDRYLNEAYRVLKPGGQIITIVPDWEANVKTYFDDYTHRTPFTSFSLNDIYKICNFTNIDVIKFRQLPILWKFPFLNLFCSLIAPFTPLRSEVKLFKWSRIIMLIANGKKPFERISK